MDSTNLLSGTILIYLSLTPTFVFGWAVSQVGHKLRQVEIDPIRLGLLSPLGLLYLVACLNILLFFSNHFSSLRELEYALGTLNKLVINQLGMPSLLYKDCKFNELPNTADLLITYPALYILLLIYLPNKAGKTLARRYFPKKSFMSEIIEAQNQLSTLNNQTANDLIELEKTKKRLAEGDTATFTILHLQKAVFSALKYLLKIFSFILYTLIIIEAIERFVSWITFIKKSSKFIISFLTKHTAIQEIETTKGWGFELVTIDISTSESRLVSGILKDYHILGEGNLSYFTLEKAYKRERLQILNGQSSQYKSIPIAIPGNCVIVPIDKTVDFNLFKTKREALIEISVSKVDFTKKGTPRLFDAPLDSDDIDFIRKAISNLLNTYISGRVVYTRFMYFYPYQYSAIIETVLRDQISLNEYITTPELIEFREHSEITSQLSKAYSLLERVNYKDSLTFVFFIEEDGTTQRKVLQDEKKKVS